VDNKAKAENTFYMARKHILLYLPRLPLLVDNKAKAENTLCMAREQFYCTCHGSHRWWTTISVIATKMGSDALIICVNDTAVAPVCVCVFARVCVHVPVPLFVCGGGEGT
jgi:hypothetical protein